jgi:hypothetical protein
MSTKKSWDVPVSYNPHPPAVDRVLVVTKYTSSELLYAHAIVSLY